MQNIATIYRFNTPFLDVDTEKKSLTSIIKKIKKSIEFDGISCVKNIKKISDYYRVTLTLEKNLGRVEFFYIADNITQYYYPVFKMNVFLDRSF